MIVYDHIINSISYKNNTQNNLILNPSSNSIAVTSLLTKDNQDFVLSLGYTLKH